MSRAARLAQPYFYPRPPRGGRPAPLVTWATVWKFLSTPSARRATLQNAQILGPFDYFYPRPPRGGRPASRDVQARYLVISIHALREEGDLPMRAYAMIWQISIHALREEGDVFRDSSTITKHISIHALREEGDQHSGTR